ncbi:gastrula zinc finger protein XlCGF49.1-like [Pseudorasbora parva]|uniref:gastrula zinc finger protein XlCGF49.1-like n=1 Tax=Pseudorasbora parva TaxID=51549 RepID=UPI00351E2E20
MENRRHRCDKTFTEKSNLTRHLKIHAVTTETFDCDVCRKSLTTKSLLISHQQQHQYPNIILYRQGEARLQCTEAAKSVAEAPAPLLTLHGRIPRQQRRLPRGPGVSCGKVSWSSCSGSKPVRPSGGF